VANESAGDGADARAGGAAKAEWTQVGEAEEKDMMRIINTFLDVLDGLLPLEQLVRWAWDEITSEGRGQKTARARIHERWLLWWHFSYWRSWTWALFDADDKP
jgi:hypothetical protein